MKIIVESVLRDGTFAEAVLAVPDRHRVRLEHFDHLENRQTEIIWSEAWGNVCAIVHRGGHPFRIDYGPEPLEARMTDCFALAETQEEKRKMMEAGL